MSPAKHGLGKGLDALLPEAEERTEVAIDQIRPKSDQPRRRFIEKEIAELAYSIRIHGLLQPLVVAQAEDGYELIAGERRLRASKLAGLRNVPVFVRTVDAQNHYELALIENLQRSDLTPVEEARAYHKLMSDFGLTQEELAKRLGKSRPKIANMIRLLQLPNRMLAALDEGSISAGHAQALLARAGAEREALFTAITSRQLSVRETEKWRTSRGNQPSQRRERPAWLDELGRELGTRVERVGKPSRGKLDIYYHSAEELASIVERLRR